MERRAIAIYGTVQGVGFRPFVHQLAERLSLGGFVKNQAGGVQIEVEGETEPLDEFLRQLTSSPPPLARIETLSWQRRSPRGNGGFEIHLSEGGIGPVAISPDIATCPACLAEMLDPRDRRYRYPFINCTHCGPRLTIVRGAPYDRASTTMAGFTMCADCRAEYENPRNRRFHAQPIACAICGPKLSLLDAHGNAVADSDPLQAFVSAILDGKIGALKGLGGYHLVCDATNPAAVAALRQRKARDEKPLAIMVADLETAREFCEIDVPEAELLNSPARPIVLLRKHALTPSPGTPGEGGGEGTSEISNLKFQIKDALTLTLSRSTGRGDKIKAALAEGIAPNNAFVGVMLPYTPLHHLLMESSGRPLVMTSGNRSDEPIAYEDTDAVRRLAGIADIFLTHNRPIHVRCDDSVTRLIDKCESPIRRSRGYAPQPISLPMDCPAPLLAVGAQLKSTFALGHHARAILSHHMGDLDHYQAFRAFERDIALYEKLFSITPTHIVHDLHPDYGSTKFALSRNLPAIAVQHHHAHVAACMAEHGLKEKVIGVAFDGSGFGPDGAVWGGEFLIADYRAFRRAGHLRYVALPGGEQAVRQPWRMAAAYLAAANVHCAEFEARQSAGDLRVVRAMIEKKINSPPTSSMGRLFDAVASLCGIRDTVSYEGQAAMQLEALAAGASADGIYPFNISTLMEIAVGPMIGAIAADADKKVGAARIARRFHSTLAEVIATVCIALRTTNTINKVILSGGVFMNALLSLAAEQRLSEAGFKVYRHEKVPPNDGGLCLGQLAIAAAQLQA